MYTLITYYENEDKHGIPMHTADDQIWLAQNQEDMKFLNVALPLTLMESNICAYVETNRRKTSGGYQSCNKY